jgi:signal transduction histidine kinase
MNLASLKEMPFDPVIEIKNCIRMFEREASAKKIELKLSVGKGYESIQVGWVSGDPVRFTQVLLNLLSNAVRFTEKASTRIIQITLDASVEEPNLSPLVATDHAPEIKTSSDDLSRSMTDSIFLISTVIDSGVGLTKEEQKKLFQKLNQSSPKTHIEYGTSGLGLVISKALVEAQGGRLTLESEKYKGTKLTFYICVKKADPPAKVPTSPLSKSFSLKATLTPRREPSPDSKLNVLVVEDNLVIGNSSILILRSTKKS